MPPDNKLLDRILRNFIGRKSNQTEDTLFWKWFWHLDARDPAKTTTDHEKQAIAQRVWLNVATEAAAQGRRPQPKTALLQRIAAAAVLCGALLIGLMFFLQRTSQPAPEKWTTIYADGHSLRKFYLPDSTQVTLDANSSLSYSSGYNMANRTVTLTGQARFEVHRDSLRPFIVDAGGVATRALGTVFNVENRPEEGEIRVALTEGKVAVTTAANRNNPDVLLPGQILLYKPATQQTRKADFSNDAYAWINGGLSFYSMPLADVLEKISKKYGLQIKYDKNRLTGKSVTASFDRADWRQMLDNLLYLHDIHYTVKNNVITLRY